MADGATIAGLHGLADTAPLLREIVFLKRIRSAGRTGSIAERLFLDAWSRLAAGDDTRAVMTATCRSALAATRLGDIDPAVLRGFGLTPTEARAILDGAIEDAAPALDPSLLRMLKADAPPARHAHAVPEFASILAAQPRAGVTCPGLPRLAMPFTENHAEHCLSVAVAGVILASCFGADPARTFVIALAHHLHNVMLPDSGFAGEVLLGAHLDGMIATAREDALRQLPTSLAAQIRSDFTDIAGAATPLAQAFHAADVLDRVLEIETCLIPSSTSMDDVLGRYALVHAGPVKGFHEIVLAEAGLS